jgi:hypothetical protein
MTAELMGRRGFLQGGFGAVGCLTLPELLRVRASAGVPNTGDRTALTDRLAEHPTERRVGAGDFLATLDRHLGIDAELATIRDPGGRPVPLIQMGGTPIRELGTVA